MVSRHAYTSFGANSASRMSSSVAVAFPRSQRSRVEERRQDEAVSVDFPDSDRTETSATDGGSDDTEQRPSA